MGDRDKNREDGECFSFPDFIMPDGQWFSEHLESTRLEEILFNNKPVPEMSESAKIRQRLSEESLYIDILDKDSEFFLSLSEGDFNDFGESIYFVPYFQGDFNELKKTNGNGNGKNGNNSSNGFEEDILNGRRDDYADVYSHPKNPKKFQRDKEERRRLEEEISKQFRPPREDPGIEEVVVHRPHEAGQDLLKEKKKVPKSIRGVRGELDGLVFVDSLVKENEYYHEFYRNLSSESRFLLRTCRYDPLKISEFPMAKLAVFRDLKMPYFFITRKKVDVWDIRFPIRDDILINAIGNAYKILKECESGLEDAN